MPPSAGLVRADGVADDRVELPDQQLLVAEVERVLRARLQRRVGGLDGVHVLHGELDRAVDHQFLCEAFGRVRRRHEVHVDLIDVRVDRLGPIGVGDVVVARPDLDRDVREEPELVVAPRGDVAAVQEVGAVVLESDIRHVVGPEKPCAEKLVDPTLVLAGRSRGAGLARRQRRRAGDRGQHVRPEQVVVVRIDRRHHLFGLGDVRIDEPAVHVRRVVPLAHRVDRQLPVAVDPGGEPVMLGHQLERIGLDGQQSVAEEFPQRHRVLGEVDEDEARPHLAVHRGHPQLALVEVEELLLVGDVVDLAVQAVAPAVVLAGERAAAPADSSPGCSCHTTLLPRWAHTL